MSRGQCEQKATAKTDLVEIFCHCTGILFVVFCQVSSVINDPGRKRTPQVKVTRQLPTRRYNTAAIVTTTSNLGRPVQLTIYNLNGGKLFMMQETLRELDLKIHVDKNGYKYTDSVLEKQKSPL